jgi:hypothetical protein
MVQVKSRYQITRKLANNSNTIPPKALNPNDPGLMVRELAVDENNNYLWYMRESDDTPVILNDPNNNNVLDPYYYSEIIGNDSDTSFIINHGLMTEYPEISIWDIGVTPNKRIEEDIFYINNKLK